MASTGAMRAACEAGYHVAARLINKLAPTITATPNGSTSTGKVSMK
jgi:hypothetical protein